MQGSGSEFERILRLKDWVAAQWEFGNPAPYPPWDAMTILDLESGEKLPVVPETLQAEYKQLIAQHVEAIGKRMIEHGFDYMQLDTAKPLDHADYEIWNRIQGQALAAGQEAGVILTGGGAARAAGGGGAAAHARLLALVGGGVLVLVTIAVFAARAAGARKAAAPRVAAGGS